MPVASPEPARATPDPLTLAATEAACAARRHAIDDALVAASRCSAGADCKMVTPGCPFGCGRAVNRSADLTQIATAITEYRTACRRCHYRCTAFDPKLVCNAGHCGWPSPTR